MSQSKQAYLLKNGKVRIQFVGDTPTKCSEATLLLIPSLEMFKALPNETYDENQIAAISKALAETGNLQEEKKPKIEMYGKYDDFYELPRIFTRVTFPAQFVNQLNNVLAYAKISIRGTYKVVQKRVAHSLSHHSAPENSLFPDLEMELGLLVETPPQVQNHRSRRLPVGPSLLGRPFKTAIWTPVDDHIEQFSVEDIQLKDGVTYENFKGFEKMGELYKSSGLNHAELSYSVILEWQDFGMDAEEGELNILGALFQDKLLFDCVVVVSNTKEFKCHRNILAVQSDVFRASFESGMKESQTHRIEMNDVCPDAVELMLEFMYCQKIELVGKSGEVVVELLKIAHKYNVEKLEKLTTQFLSRQPNDWFTINGALELYLFTVNVDSLQNLTRKLKSVMRANSQQLSSCSNFKNWMSKNPSAAAQFALMLLEPQQTAPPSS